MIISFSVQNFRSIQQKVTLDFRASSDKHHEDYFVFEIPKPKLRILRMAMIYGANASGKTNLLRALDFLRDLVVIPKRDKDEPIDYLPFALKTEKPSIFELDFYHEEVVYSYKLQLNTKRILSESLDYYPKGRIANVFMRTYDPQKDVYEYKWTYPGYKKSVLENLELSIRNHSILTSIASIEAQGPLQQARDWFRDFLFPMLHPQQGLNPYLFREIESKSLSQEFALSLVKTADLMISGYELDIKLLPTIVHKNLENEPNPIREKDSERTRRIIQLMIEHSVEGAKFDLDFNEQSSGTQRFFGFTALLNVLIHRPVTILIDEIDCSMHHDLVVHFLYMFLKNSRFGQLIFTSHNLSLLSEKELARRDSIWIIERKADGSTDLQSVWDFPVRKEHSIESLYKKGFLGGKPSLGSIDIEEGNG